MDIPRNYNRHLTSEPYNYEKVQNSFSSMKKGMITNTYGISGRIGMYYDVRLLDSGVTLSGVKSLVNNGGLNGEGEFFSYDVDTPVLLLFNEGKLGQGEGYIVGTFTTEGDYTSFYKEGKLQNYNERLDGELFNQPFNHPNRVSQEDAFFRVINSKSVNSPYDSPEFYQDVESRDGARGVPGILEMHNRDGTSVNYNIGDRITYVDGNNIIISGGKKKTKCESYMELSKRHLQKAKLYNGSVELKSEADEAEGEIQSPIVKRVPAEGFSFTEQSVVQQELTLASVYCELAKKCNEMGAANLSAVNSMSATFPSLDGVGDLTALKVEPNFKPPESTSPVASGNYGERKNASGTLPAMILVFHETVGTLEGTLAHFKNSSAQVSYHAVISLEGEIVYLTPSTKRAYGAGVSKFKDEVYGNSVNSFAYQISLESPPDAETDHSGYTVPQYKSLAWLSARTGIPRERFTTHKEVSEAAGRTDRTDPRQFSWERFYHFYNQFEVKGVIDFGI